MASTLRHPFPFRPEIWHVQGLLAWEDGQLDRALELLGWAFAAEPDGGGFGADLCTLLLSRGTTTKQPQSCNRPSEHRPSDSRLRQIREERDG